MENGRRNPVAAARPVVAAMVEAHNEGRSGNRGPRSAVAWPPARRNPASQPSNPVRTWLTLWLCACLLLASPVRGACCFDGDAALAGTVAAAEDAHLPPCHRMDPASDDAGGERESPAPERGQAGCDHCQCPCRVAAVPLTPAAERALPAPTFPPVPALDGFAERSRIPPLPPPIA